MKLTVKRDKWWRGDGPSRLFGDGGMCCLGFLALELGYTIDDIENLRSPAHLDTGKVAFPSTLITPTYGHDMCNTELCTRLMNVNDNRVISNATRELNLTRLFKDIDIEVEFV